MKYGILGGGFGLYGYLPAVQSLIGSQVCTLERYRATIRLRTELAACEGRVRFFDSYWEMARACDVMILALPPFEQEKVLARLIADKWRGGLILEKPLAVTPEAAQTLFDRLVGAEYSFRIGFSFIWTDWFQSIASRLRDNRGSPCRISISWVFQADHYQNRLETWKRYTDQGGGALRYYGIQMIAAAAKTGLWDAVTCQRMRDGREETACDFSLTTDPLEWRFHCDTRNTDHPLFEVRLTGSGEPDVRLERGGPFEPIASDERSASSEIRPKADRRIPHLIRGVESLREPAGDYYPWYARHLRLWSDLERSSDRPR